MATGIPAFWWMLITYLDDLAMRSCTYVHLRALPGSCIGKSAGQGQGSVSTCAHCARAPPQRARLVTKVSNLEHKKRLASTFDDINNGSWTKKMYNVEAKNHYSMTSSNERRNNYFNERRLGQVFLLIVWRSWVALEFTFCAVLRETRKVKIIENAFAPRWHYSSKSTWAANGDSICLSFFVAESKICQTLHFWCFY